MQDSAQPVAPEEILDSWKDIARYLNRDVRTIQRWERSKHLPVHRLPGGVKPGVFALKSEVDSWRKSSPLDGADPQPAGPHALAPSVAVLPFVNLTGGREDQYFGDGLADEIITALSQIPSLRVTARTSSFRFRGHGHDVRDIGGRLGVRSILTGTVRRSGVRIRVSAQLVDAANGFHLWSEHFDREGADVFEIQDEISTSIARLMAVRLAPPSASRRTSSLEAYHAWLKGRYFQQYESAQAITRCREAYEQAIALDPSFPHPYLGIAEWYRGFAHYGIMCPRQAGTQGWAAIRKALQLDDSIAEAYALSATYRAWMDFDWTGADADFQRALSLNPASAEICWLKATMFLLPLNRLDEAIALMERVISLDPLSPLMHSHFAWILSFHRDFERALRETATALALSPNHAVAFAIRGSVFYHCGRMEEGVACWRAAVEGFGRSSIALGALGYGLARLGRMDESNALLAEIDTAEREGAYVTPISRAWIYVGTRDFENAFHYLNRALDDREPHLLHLPCKEIYDPMRQDPRFAALLARMRLA